MCSQWGEYPCYRDIKMASFATVREVHVLLDPVIIITAKMYHSFTKNPALS